MFKSLVQRSHSQLTRRVLVSSVSPHIQFQSVRRFAEGDPRTDIVVKKLPEAPAGDPPDFFSFTFGCPHKDLYNEAPVRMVGIPGSDGKFAVTPGHIPTICEMQPGTLSIYYEKSETSGKQDHFFVGGGFAIVHPNGTLDVAATEAVYLADLETTHVKEGLSKAREKVNKAQNDKEKYEAEIEVETFESIERCMNSSTH